MYSRYFFLLVLVLFAKTAVVVFAMMYSGIGLGPDEAQYWTWSQLLDWGYYSKPPGIAWEIWAGTQILGNTVFGVRFGALVLGIAIPLMVFLLAKNSRLSPNASFWAAICMAIAPLGLLASFLAITDGGMVFFWTAACAYAAKKIEEQESPNYFILGLIVLCGALFKWPMYFFWPLLAASWLVFPFMRSWKVLGGIIVSFLALLPSLYWNMTHEWATFRHVSSTLVGGHAQKANYIFNGNAGEFIGAQFALVSPILFILLLGAFWKMCRQWRTMLQGVLFCGGMSLVILCLGIIVSFFMKIQGNWAIFAYPTAFVVLAWYVLDSSAKFKKWFIGGLILSLVLCGMIFSIPKIQSSASFSTLQIPYKWNPFRHNVGVENVEKILVEAGYDPNEDFLFGDKYQTTSLLSFYGPQQKRAYFLNLLGARKNQFSFWPGMDKEQVGKRGFFVVIENDPQLDRQWETLSGKYKQMLLNYFEKVSFLGVKPLFWSYGKVVKGALLFECQGYNGKMIADPNLY